MLIIQNRLPRPGSRPAADRFTEAVEQLIAANSDFASYVLPAGKNDYTDFKNCALRKGRRGDHQIVEGEFHVWLRPASKWTAGTQDGAQFAVMAQSWLERIHPGETLWQGTAAQWHYQAQRDPEITAEVFPMPIQSLGRRFREAARIDNSGISVISEDPKHGNRYQITLRVVQEAAQRTAAEAAARREAAHKAQVPYYNTEREEWLDRNTGRPVLTMRALEAADGIVEPEDALEAS